MALISASEGGLPVSAIDFLVSASTLALALAMSVGKSFCNAAILAAIAVLAAARPADASAGKAVVTSPILSNPAERLALIDPLLILSIVSARLGGLSGVAPFN